MYTHVYISHFVFLIYNAEKGAEIFQLEDEALQKQFLMFICLIRFWDDSWTFPSPSYVFLYNI